MMSRNLTRIRKLTHEIAKNAICRVSEQDSLKMFSVVFKIFHITECQGHEIKHLQKLKKSYEKTVKITFEKIKKVKTSPSTCYQDILSDDITSLKKIVDEYNFSENLQSFFIYKNNLKVQAEVEMLILSILSSLEHSNLYLITSQLSNEAGPLLIGRYLRNYLAHGNPLVDILKDTCQFIYLYALKIIKHDIYRKENLEITCMKNKSSAISIVENQERLFDALSGCSLENVIQAIREGADMYGRDINLMTTLHFAAKSTNFDVMKYLVNHGLNPMVKDFFGRNLLHVAAEAGCKNIVDYIIEELHISVDEKCGRNHTALYIAAENGLVDIVITLLRHNAAVKVGPFNETPIYAAVINNEVKVIELFFQTIKDIYSIQLVQGFTLLHFAAEMGLLDMVLCFLDKGADVNSVSDELVTPLHRSASAGHSDMVSTLISKKANVNAKDSFNRTPLHYAALSGQSNTVEVLLNHGADLEALDNKGHLPLQSAIINGSIEVIKTITKHGASIEDVAAKDFLILEYAMLHNNLELINFVIDNEAPINVRNESGSTPLHRSIQNGLIDISLKLIECGAEINVVKNGLTPLSLSIGLGYFGIADKLLSKEADIYIVDKRGDTLLHKCASISDICNFLFNDYEKNNKEKYNELVSNSNGLDIFDRLVKMGADIEKENKNGHTPLHVACLFGNIPIVQYLIKNSADPNMVDKIRFSPLHFATYGNHLEVVKIILESRKCSLNSKTFEGDTALCIASSNNYTDMTKVLIKNGADVNDGDPLFKALMQGHQDICVILLQNKSTDIERQFKDKSGKFLQIASIKGLERVVSSFLEKKKFSKSVDMNECLLFAIQWASEDIVTLFLNHGADMNFAFENQKTPLHLAVERDHSKIIKVLLERGADFNKLNSIDLRPIEVAVGHGHLESVKAFFQNITVDVNEKGNCDHTLIHIAATWGHLDITKFLISNNAALNIGDKFGSKPIHLAAQFGHLHIVKYFLQCDPKLLTDRGGSNNSSPLHFAAHGGHAEIAKYLIEKGMDVNAPSDHGIRPIHVASQFGREEVLNVLLNYGAMYDSILDRVPSTPLLLTHNENIKKTLMMIKELFHAVKSNNISDVKSLIDKGACMNAKDSKNSTVLHYAAWKGYAEVTQLLLENKANPNVFAKGNATPLHYASKYGKYEVAKVLLENGAIYNAMSTDGKAPVDLASNKSIIDLLELIDSAFRDVQNCNIQILETLEKFRNSDVLKSVVCAKNIEGKNLMICAFQHKFSKLDHLTRIFSGDPQTRNEIFNYIFVKEDCVAASDMQANLLQKNSQLFGSDNPVTLETEEMSAFILFKQKKYEQALDIFQAIFQKKKEMLGPSNSRTLNTQFFVAHMLQCLGRNLEAIEIFDDLYSRLNELRGLSNIETLITILHSAEVLCDLGLHEDALKRNDVVFAKFYETLGADNALTIQSLDSRGNILSHLSAYDDALACYKCVYNHNNKLSGPSSSETLKSLQNIKHVLCLQNLTDENLEGLREVFDTQKNVLGLEHLDTLKTERNLGELLFRRGKFREGFEMSKENLEKQKVALGHKHSTVLRLEKLVERMKYVVDMLDIQNSSNLNNKTSETPSSYESLIRDQFQHKTIDREGRTFLHVAASEGLTAFVSDQLQIGCNVMHTKQKGNTALHIASVKGHAEIVELLLVHVKENNCDELNTFINAKTKNGGNSALHAAANVETAKTLLKYGAIYNIRNKDGKTPKEYTSVKEISDFLEIIEEFFIGALIGDSKIICTFQNLRLEEKMAVSNARNELNHTMKQVGLKYGHKNIIDSIELDV
nr:uncharacterized protein LOC107440007 [Parasteatoda tepidariorum]